MNHIELFADQNKKRIIYTLIILLFWIPAIALRYLGDDLYVFHIRADIIATALQVISLPFVFLCVKNIKCPACKKNAGGGWNIKACKNCGEKLKE